MFFYVAASNPEKYHPAQNLGEGGLHLADYIASRKFISMYDLNNNKIN